MLHPISISINFWPGFGISCVYRSTSVVTICWRVFLLYLYSYCQSISKVNYQSEIILELAIKISILYLQCTFSCTDAANHIGCRCILLIIWHFSDNYLANSEAWHISLYFHFDTKFPSTIFFSLNIIKYTIVHDNCDYSHHHYVYINLTISGDDWDYIFFFGSPTFMEKQV